MGNLDRMPCRANARLGAVQIPIVDWKASNLETYQPAMEYVANVRTRYRQHNFATGDKITTDIALGSENVLERIHLLLQEPDRRTEKDGATGKRKKKQTTKHTHSPDGFFYNFVLPFPHRKHQKVKRVRNLIEALSVIANPQPGGNVPNMMRNIAHLMQADFGPEEIRLFSPKEPFFHEWLRKLPEHVRERIDLTHLDIQSRLGLHLPYPKETEPGTGTLALVSPSHSTLEVIKPHIRELADCNHSIVSEGLGSLVTGLPKIRQKFVQLLNPSGGWRAQCAVDAWMLREFQHNMRGRVSIPTMNGEEMDEFIRHMQAPQTNTDFKDLPPIPFSSPFFPERMELNGEGVKTANIGFSKFFQSLPPEDDDCLHFPTSVSLGGEGGYHIALTGGKKYVCFASTPNKKGAKKMIDLLGKQSKIDIRKERTMGAGDSVAAILSLTRIWDLENMMHTLSRRNDPPQEKFIHIASTIFVSLLSRVMGEYVFHSDQCDITDVPVGKIEPIMKKTAELSLEQARLIWNATKKVRTLKLEEWGMRLALWELREQ